MTLHHRAESFPAISTLRSHTLILGSMPGIRSLEAQQYYAHPQNAFWQIMGELYGAPVETYQQRLALIRKNNLALWDVLKFCTRRGSLDNRIENSSIKVNEFEFFFRSRPLIRRVFFNGTKAEQEFRRRVIPVLSAPILARLTLKRLPSTSPAHAALRPVDKLKAWRAVKKP